MGCKGPFDARFETAQSARRALSDYAIKNVQKRNFSKMGCSIFLPSKKLKNLLEIFKISKNQKNKKTKNQNVSKMTRTQKLGPVKYLI